MKVNYADLIVGGTMRVLDPMDFRKGALKQIIDDEGVTHLTVYFVEDGLDDLKEEVADCAGLKVCTFGYKFRGWDDKIVEEAEVMGVEVNVYEMQQ